MEETKTERQEKAAAFEACVQSNTSTPLHELLKAKSANDADTADGVDHLKAYIREFEANEQLTSATSKLVASLCDELVGAWHELPTEVLVELCGQAVKLITEDMLLESGRVLELLPKLLSLAAIGGNFEAKAASAIDELCEHDWPEKHVSHAAGMFLDITLSEEQLKNVVDKLVNQIAKLPHEEMPPLTYQLLLLANKGRKAAVVKGIIESVSIMEDKVAKATSAADESETCSFVENSSEGSNITLEQLRPVQGTIIHHMTAAAKQDQELGREVVKYLKSDVEFTPFATALALALSRIHRFEDSVFGLLKSRVSGYFREEERRTASPWLYASTEPGIDFGGVLKATVDNSSDWDQVAHGLVILGMALMDTSRVDSNKETSPAFLTCKLGSDLLHQTFDMHQRLRPEILDLVLSRICSKSSGSTEQYTGLLASIVQEGMHMMMDNVEKIRAFFDHISFVAPKAAIGLLEATMPLVVISNPLRDALMLVLRKSMFNRDVSARMIAIKGFLLLLGELKVATNHASQTSQAITSNHEALGLEIFSMLKRCTTQQAEVRSAFYSGLVKLVQQKETFVATALDLLMSHVGHYVDLSDEATRPLALSACVPYSTDAHGAVIVVEPVGELLACLLKIMRVSDAQSHASSDKIGKWFLALTKKLVKTDLEDFELDKSSNFGTDESSRGMANIKRAELLLSVYQVMIDFVAGSTPDFRMEMSSLILALSKKVAILEDNLKTKMDKKAKVTVPNVFEFDTFIDLLESLACDKKSEHQSGLILLRNNAPFIKYIMRLGISLLETASTDTELHPRFVKLGKVAVMEYAAEGQTALQRSAGGNAEDGAAAGKKEKKGTKSIKLLCLDLINSITVLSNVRLKGQTVQLISQCVVEANAITDGDDESAAAAATDAITWLREAVTKTIEDEKHRESSVLVGMLAIVTVHIDAEALTGFRNWLDELCTATVIEDTSVAKGLLTMLLKVNEKESLLALAKTFAMNAKLHLGDMSDEPEESAHKEYKLISHEHSESWVPGLLLSQFGIALDEVEWYSSRMQAKLSAKNPKPGSDSLVVLSERLSAVLAFSMQLVQTEQDGNVTDLFKYLRRLFGVLLTVAKSQLVLFGGKKDQDLSLPREVREMLESTGPYASAVHQLMTSAQEKSGEYGEKTNEKKKRGKTNAANARVAPNLVYAMEKYEQVLIQLDRKPQSTFKLLKHFKRSVARDFRVKHGDIVKALEEKENSQAGTEMSGKAKGKRKQLAEPGTGSTTKKRKTKAKAK